MLSGPSAPQKPAVAATGEGKAEAGSLADFVTPFKKVKKKRKEEKEGGRRRKEEGGRRRGRGRRRGALVEEQKCQCNLG